MGVAGGGWPVIRFGEIIYLDLVRMKMVNLARSMASKRTQIVRPRASVDACHESARVWAAQLQTPTRRIARGLVIFLKGVRTPHVSQLW